MRLRFLGVGAALRSEYHKSALLIDDRVLVDAGADCVPAIHSAGVPIEQIAGIAITHMHGDHYFGVGFLIAEAMASPNDREGPLHIVGPEGVGEAIRQLLALAYPVTDPDVFLRKSKAHFTEITDGSEFSLGGLRFIAHSIDHGRMTAYSFEVHGEDGSTLYVSGDGRPSAASAARLCAADALVASTPTFVDALPAHSSVADYSRLFDSEGKRPDEVFIVHRSFPASECTEFKVPEDGDVHEV